MATKLTGVVMLLNLPDGAAPDSFAAERLKIVRAFATLNDEAWGWCISRLLFMQRELGGFTAPAREQLGELQDLIMASVEPNQASDAAAGKPPTP